MMDPWLLIVLLGACALTAGLLVPRKGGQQEESGRGLENMRTSLEQFMENMEADQREMVETALRAQQQQREDNASRDERIAALERRCVELEQLAARTESRLEARIHTLQASLSSAGSWVSGSGPLSGAALPAETAAADAKPQTDAIRSRYPELFALHDAGRPIDLIAKKVGMNKGEVMLILQLSKQEEAHRV